MLNQKIKQSIISHGTLLGAFAFCATLALAMVYALTFDTIAQQRSEAEKATLYEVMPQRSHNNNLLNDTISLFTSQAKGLNLLGLSEEQTGTPAYAYLARNQEELVGIILPSTVHDGYNGRIDLLIGIYINGNIAGVRVINHSETPGLGDKIEPRVSSWIFEFDGKSLINSSSGPWQVKKEGGDFDQFTGATITPRAVVKGVYQALLFFEENRSLWQ